MKSKRRRISKKTVYFLILTVVMLLLAVFIFTLKARTNSMAHWGETLNSYSQADTASDTLYAVGRSASVSEKDVRQAEDFYGLQGFDRQEARRMAVDYMEKREALYEEAVKNGYDVTDREVYDYLEELKAIIDSADNREDAYNVMAAFESEDAYWDYQFSVYKKNLPIQNYVKDLEKQFYSAQSHSNGETGTWEAYFESYKEQLKEAQDFKVTGK